MGPVLQSVAKELLAPCFSPIHLSSIKATEGCGYTTSRTSLPVSWNVHLCGFGLQHRICQSSSCALVLGRIEKFGHLDIIITARFLVKFEGERALDLGGVTQDMFATFFKSALSPPI